jgi:hypothetical protein
MATDQQVMAAYRKLLPFLQQALGEEQVNSLNQGIAAGEPYEALGWLMSSINQPGITVPKDIFLQAFNCLTDEDKTEYEPLLLSLHVNA